MKLTKEQIETLSKWERQFDTATRANWASNPGREALTIIHKIYTEATGDTSLRLNTTCSHCILQLLRAAGKLYFESRSAKEVAVEPKPAKKVRKTVKTKKDAV